VHDPRGSESGYRFTIHAKQLTNERTTIIKAGADTVTAVARLLKKRQRPYCSHGVPQEWRTLTGRIYLLTYLLTVTAFGMPFARSATLLT